MSDILRQFKNYIEMLKESGIDFLPKVPKENHATQSVLMNVDDEVNDSISEAGFTELKRVVLKCTKCSELASKRKTVVFGAGNFKAQLVFVGEAPGHDEDLQGLPFVGMAGQLLTKIIKSIGLKREDVFICNVLKCRPPGNRNPLPQEIFNCEPYLIEQIRFIRPKIICALGTFAAQTLLKTDQRISSLRGKFHHYQGSKLLCTFHPAYLLRNPEEKRKVWEDMKMIRAELTSTRTELRPHLPLERSAPTGESSVV